MIHELLRLEDLSLSLNGVKQIQHMNFAVVEGRAAGVAGPAGGGKTALAKALCGELTPDHSWLLLSQDGRQLLAHLSTPLCYPDYIILQQKCKNYFI